jgi:YD repeat-containing protein
VSEYDDRGNITSVTWLAAGAEARVVDRNDTVFDSDDREVESHQTGSREHYRVYSYNSTGQLSEVTHLDARRKPIDIYFDYKAFDDPWGWHRVTLLYDASGRHTFDVYARVNGREVRRVDCSVRACW